MRAGCDEEDYKNQSYRIEGFSNSSYEGRKEEKKKKKKKKKKRKSSYDNKNSG